MQKSRRSGFSGSSSSYAGRIMKDPSTVDAQIPAERSFKLDTFRMILTCDPSMRRGLRSGSNRVLGRVADQMQIRDTAFIVMFRKRGVNIDERIL
jgi:hypothetical protein